MDRETSFAAYKDLGTFLYVALPLMRLIFLLIFIPLTLLISDVTYRDRNANKLLDAKLTDRIQRLYHWPSLVNDVKHHLNGCDIYKLTKHLNYVLRASMDRTTMTQRIFQKLYVVFLGPYPRIGTGIFVVLDHL